MEAADMEESVIDVNPEDLILKDEVNLSVDDEENHADVQQRGGRSMPYEGASISSKEIKMMKILQVRIVKCSIPVRNKPGPASSKCKSISVASTSTATMNNIISPGHAVSEYNESDHDDSINLTIGEEDAQLTEEEDSKPVREPNKDGEAHQDVDDVDDESLMIDVDDEAQSSVVDSCENVPTEIFKDETIEDNQEIAEKSSQEASDKVENADTKNAFPDGLPSEKVSDEDNTASFATSSIPKEAKDIPTKQSPVSRNLWVSGLAASTRASDLKYLFSRYGKVIGAKVVTNAKSPGDRCYGYITMATNDEASRCIQRLNHTELHGRIISLEKAKTDSINPPKKPDNIQHATDEKSSAPEVSQTQDSEIKLVETVELNTMENVSDGNDQNKTSESSNKADSDTVNVAQEQSMNKSVSEKDKSRSKSRHNEMGQDKSPLNHLRFGKRPGINMSFMNKDREKQRRMDVLSFAKIKEVREIQRLREHHRALREEERRGREELIRAQYIEKRQRDEAQRLAREREKLHMEREKIEREKKALMRAERQRQMMERERLEYEKMKLKRQKMKIAEAHRAVLPERRFEAPPPPLFDIPITSGSGYEPDISAKDFQRIAFNRSDDFMRDSFKRGGLGDFKHSVPDFNQDFDIAPRHAAQSGSTGAIGMQYQSSAYSSHRDARDTNRHATHAVPMRRDGPDIGMGSRGKNARFPVHLSSADRGIERGGAGAGTPFRGGQGIDRETRNIVPDHRSGKQNLRGGEQTRERFADSSKAFGGRYADRSSGVWISGGSGSNPEVAPGTSDVRGPNCIKVYHMGPSKPNWTKPANPIGSGSNDRWSSGPLCPPGVNPEISLPGRSAPLSSGTHMSHRYNMPSNMRKF